YRIVHKPIDFRPLHEAVVPQSIIALITSCTAKDPAQRPQNFSAICLELEQEIRAVSKESKPVPGPLSSLNPWVLGGVLLVVIVMMLGISVYVPRSSTKVNDTKADAPPRLPSTLQTASGEMVLVPEGEFLSGMSQQ